MVTEPTDVPAAPSKQMTVLLRVDQPDIILVEKMDDINCLALILNVGQFFSDNFSQLNIVYLQDSNRITSAHPRRQTNYQRRHIGSKVLHL